MNHKQKKFHPQKNTLQNFLFQNFTEENSDNESCLKADIRKQYKELRNALPPETVQTLSMQISDLIIQWDLYRKADTIFFYYPLAKEVSLLPVIKDALAHGKRAAFPKTDEHNHMEFYPVDHTKQLKEGRFHVMEPVTEGIQPLKTAPSVCFVPGTVFDRTGIRFGYGKGYYDRYFAEKEGCILVGCAYECQIAEKLPADTWDIKMHYLVSEKGRYSCFCQDQQQNHML